MRRVSQQLKKHLSWAAHAFILNAQTQALSAPLPDKNQREPSPLPDKNQEMETKKVVSFRKGVFIMFERAMCAEPGDGQNNWSRFQLRDTAACSHVEFEQHVLSNFTSLQ
jgi:hypothetical protein